MDIVAIHYDDIKRIYTLRDNNKKQKFDEDSFNEAFIKCASKFGNNIITYDDAIKYFWIAYSNTYKSSKTNKFIEFDIDAHDYIDNTYNENIDTLVSDIFNNIEKKFGKNNRDAYELYICQNWKINDIINKGIVDKDFPNTLKRIKRFISKNYKNIDI